MRRAEICWCDIGSIAPRPVVLLSRDNSYRARGRATVALITSRVRGIPVEVPIGEREGSAINVDEVSTVRVDQLGDRLGFLDADQRDRLDAALHFALGLRG